MTTTPIETPWLIEGGASHSVQVARNVSFAALGGVEGIVRGADLEVRELAVPGAQVRIFPGTAGVQNRAAGAKDEMYVARVGSEETLDIAPTDAGGTRSDLIVLRIENPWAAGETWPDPGDVTTGPYASLAVISNVASNTKSVSDLGLSADHTMIALARVDIPISTSIITQDMIVDLRTMANAVSKRDFNMVAPTSADALTEAAFTNWPAEANMTIDVPEWATHVKVRAILSGIKYGAAGTNGGAGWNAVGNLRVQLGYASGAEYSQQTAYNESNEGGSDRCTLMCGAPTLLIPAAARGEANVPVRIEGLKSSGSTDLTADANSMVSIEVEFINEPESNV